MFCLSQLAEKSLARNREVHLIFIDLKKAYDSVPIKKLWNVLEDTDINPIYINTIKKLYEENTGRVKIDDKLSDEFLCTKGLRQGCSLSPTLFKIYLSKALENWQRKCKHMGIPIGDENLYTLLFADDQIITAGDEDDIQYLLRKVIEEYDKWGLTLNTEKTKYLVIGGQGHDIVTDKGIIKTCQEYKYLGVMVTKEGIRERDIINRSGQGRKSIQMLNSVLWSKDITKNTKKTIYKTITESITTYGSEVWVVNKRMENRLMAVEMDFWRRSCRVSRLDRVRNETIRERMEVEDSIIDTINKKKLLWYGHLNRMPNRRWPYKILNWVPPERRKRGRPRTRWKEEIEKIMRSHNLEEGDWEDRKLWRQRSEKRQQL